MTSNYQFSYWAVLDLKNYDPANQRAHSDVKWYWRDHSTRGFNDGTLFPWDPPVPLQLKWIPVFRQTSRVQLGYYCGYIDAGNDWKWGSGLCRVSRKALTTANAFCKVPRGMQTKIQIYKALLLDQNPT